MQGVTVAPRRVTLREAAGILEVSKEAVRKRVSRGTLRHDKGPDGTVYVYLDAGGDAGGDAPDIYEEMRSRIESLERQLEEANTRDRENRRLLAAALERIPELEAPPATPQEAERVAESAGGVADRGESAEPEAATSQRPWWRRWIGR
jgi:hypothetical protein